MPNDAWAVEDDDDHSNRNFTRELFGNSEMFPAPELADRVAYASLGCGHTNTGLESINQERPTQFEVLKGGDESRTTIYSRKLFTDDPGLQDACKEGMKWKILRKGTEIVYPGLVDIIQDAINIKAKNQRPDSQFQVLAKVHAEVSNMRHTERINDTLTVKWDEILRVVAATKPSCLSDVSAIVSFYKKWAGGAQAPYVAELGGFAKVHVPSRRSIPKYVFTQLAGLQVDVANVGELTHIVAATLKCMALSPNTACSQMGQFECSKFFSAFELSNLHERPLAAVADKILKECREIAKKEGCPVAVYNKLTGRFGETQLYIRRVSFSEALSS